MPDDKQGCLFEALFLLVLLVLILFYVWGGNK